MPTNTITDVVQYDPRVEWDSLNDYDRKLFSAGLSYQFKYTAQPSSSFVRLFKFMLDVIKSVPFLYDLILDIWYYGVISPLQYIYFRGPKLMGWGFWDGMHPHDICSELTNHKMRFVSGEHDATCHSMLVNKFESFLVLFLIFIYVLCIVVFVKKCTKGSSKSKVIYTPRFSGSTRIVSTPTPTPTMTTRS